MNEHRVKILSHKAQNPLTANDHQPTNACLDFKYSVEKTKKSKLTS
jgi:hypothetical protein